MQFSTESMGPAFTALQQPFSQPVQIGGSTPTQMFGGHAPAVHFGTVAAIHPGHVEPVTRVAPVTPVVGNRIDVRG